MSRGLGKYLEIVLRFIYYFFLVLIVNFLTIVMGKRLKAFTTHKKNPYLGQMLARSHVSCFLEELLELFLPPEKEQKKKNTKL